MSKITAEARSALQSARAKNRKQVEALGTAGLRGVNIPKHIVTKIQNIEAWYEGMLTATVTKLPEGAVEEAAAELHDEKIAATG